MMIGRRRRQASYDRRVGLLTEKVKYALFFAHSASNRGGRGVDPPGASGSVGTGGILSSILDTHYNNSIGASSTYDAIGTHDTFVAAGCSDSRANKRESFDTRLESSISNDLDKCSDSTVLESGQRCQSCDKCSELGAAVSSEDALFGSDTRRHSLGPFVQPQQLGQLGGQLGAQQLVGQVEQNAGEDEDEYEDVDLDELDVAFIMKSTKQCKDDVVARLNFSFNNPKQIRDIYAISPIDYSLDSLKNTLARLDQIYKATG